MFGIEAVFPAPDKLQRPSGQRSHYPLAKLQSDSALS